MKKIVMTAALIMMASSANALTIKSGEVLTTAEDGTQIVVDAGSTTSAQNNLANKGYHIGGGNIYLDVGGETVVVETSQLAGKSKEEVKEILGAEIVEQITDLQGSVDQEVADLIAEGVDAVNATELTADQIVDQILNSDGSEGAFVGVTEGIHNEVVEGLISSGEPFYDPDTGICHNCP